MERTRFTGYETTRQGFIVTARTPDGGLIKASCDHLVGADGAVSEVRRAFNPEGARQAKSCVANYSYYEYDGLGRFKDDWWHVFLRPEFGDIISCAHVKDDVLALSVGGFLGAKLLQFENRFVNHLAREFGVQFGARRSTTGCGLKIAPPCLGKDNLLLAGDAAGLIYLNGEGISAAMDSGYRAGQAIAESSKSNTAETALRYEANCGDILNHMRLCLDNMNFVVPPA